MQLKMSRCLIVFVFFSSFSTSNAQQMEDLGRTKPFLIGLKGTIYNFVFPKTKSDFSGYSRSIGYTPEIEKTEPIGYVYTQSLNISERDLNEPFPGVPPKKWTFAIIYTGNFEIRDSAEYLFVLKSDDGSRLWIDGKEIINHDGLHQFNLVGAGKVWLSKGFHSIKVWYFQGLATRMGLLLIMKKTTDKDFAPFDLKPEEEKAKKTLGTEGGDSTTLLCPVQTTLYCSLWCAA